MKMTNAEMAVANEELIAKYKDHGCKKSLARLVEMNTPLIHKLAGKLCHPGNDDYQDIVQAGFVGFLKGVERFDTSRNVGLATYVFNWIRLEMQEFFLKNSVSISGTVGALRFSRTVMALSEFMSDEQIAEKMGVTVAKVRKVKASPIVTPLIPMDDAGEIEAEESMASFESMSMEDSRIQWVERALHELTEREQIVIRSLFGIGSQEATGGSVGRDLGISRERVRQIGRSATRRLAAIARREGIDMSDML